ncbi:GNAT family N-acetyltransferase [Luteolibacter sp. GHJ8]|uniref:GNAT family N-acetyltransferase n=1 Tax=Luteolibacter rhizosphaerae TaxID=2989719 RepID=A0ABT3GA57_9BACT|nr:GNAT family N-acetyltransferase [Luteolibacter rhizosphaerae]MCW1916717.1 GNAT family N-acetyltransferase [Luteolibacter rhizosphaerae]
MKPPENFHLPRLRLRRPLVSDVDAMFEYGSDPEVARYADWPVRTSKDGMEEGILRRAQQWEAGTDYYWVITLPEEDRAIGGISCSLESDAAEIGFLLHRRHWGKGFATEAARAVLTTALSLSRVNKVWATCDTGNTASIRVLEKIGMKRDGILHASTIRPNLAPGIPRDAFSYVLGRGDLI